ncbi:MAG: hypothetical protein AB1724_16730 [Thermodesulfobacteriota bacterium]
MSLRNLLWLIRILFVYLHVFVAAGFCGDKPDVKPGALDYLAAVQDKYHRFFYVYSDAEAAGNHFTIPGRTGNVVSGAPFPSMETACLEHPFSGVTCIRAESGLRGRDWGGWYFLNGVLTGDGTGPKENWGDHSKAGFDLTGATALTFQARGARGGERVEFFAFGVGRNDGKPFPDSSPTVSTGFIRLTSQWKPYRIDLAGKPLNYVIGGFGWITNAIENQDRSVVFFLDDIRYDKSRNGQPRFLVSYAASAANDSDARNRDVAFVYDNALAAIAFTAAGQKDRAGLIVDAFLYALENDRYYRDGRLRNAYQGGDLAPPPGWRPAGEPGAARMPYRLDESGAYREDGYEVSTHTGNMAWAVLALVAYYDAFGGTPYLAAAEQMGQWIEENCRDSINGGYAGGFDGWEPSPVRLTFKSTEHNIDLVAAFDRLHRTTGRPEWRERAEHARRFILSMWDPVEGKFWTGTRSDGRTVNTDVVPLDVQTWAALVLNDPDKTGRALRYMETHHKVGDGFDYNTDLDGIWYEGTAQAAVACAVSGDARQAARALEAVKAGRLPDGGVPAASRDGLTTGFYLSDGKPCLYDHRAHVGATAWLYFAENGINPFSSSRGVR